MAKYRKELYAIWRSCERFNILPPGVTDNWDSNNVWGQAQLIAYDQIRQVEDVEHETNMLKATHGTGSKNKLR